MGCGSYILPTHCFIIHVFVAAFILSVPLSHSLVPAAALPSTVLPSYRKHIERERASPSGHSPSIVRHYKLHSRCSGRHILINGRQLNALAPIGSQHARLRVETVSFGSRVRIQSDVSRDFMCFNRRGKLIVRHSGNSNRCVFREIHAPNGFTEFRSAANVTWYIGFDRRGHRLPGQRWPTTTTTAARTGSGNGDEHIESRDRATARRCYQFTKTDFPYIGETAAHSTGHGHPPERPSGGRNRENVWDSADASAAGAGDERQPWAPRIDYRHWFSKIIARQQRRRRPARARPP